jgi:hypothetical protein
MLFYILSKTFLNKSNIFLKCPVRHIMSACQAERYQCQYMSTTLQLSVGYKCKKMVEYWGRTIHTKNSVELANCKETDRRTDTGIHAYAHKQYSDLINLLSLLKKQKQVKNKRSAMVGRSERTARKSTLWQTQISPMTINLYVTS